MFLLNKAPNPLLKKITHFLQKKKSQEYTKKIFSLINTVPTSELIPSFVFLSRWISENSDSQKRDSDYDQKKQTAIYMIGQISLKLPTVIHLTGFFESNMQTSKSHWLMRDFYIPLYKRIVQLRSYLKPFSLYSQLPSSFQTFPEEAPIFLTPTNNHSTHIYESRNYRNFYIELESNPSYRSAIQLYFKRMIINHASIESFKPLVCQRSSRSILTKAIIELLQDLNKNREATQEELIFAFSSVFLYIHAFVLSNEIDSQLLCDYLQTQTFISPFCALAMVNLIPSNLYLFNLLSPRELSVNLDHQTELKTSQYVMVDLSKSSNLNGFTAKMPLIMSNYFLSNNVTSTSADTYNKLDDNEFLSFIHLSSANLYNKMKVVLTVTRDRALGSVQVSSMGILLLRCIILSVQKTYLDCVDTHMFTESFINFIRTIFSMMTIVFSESLGMKFFDTGLINHDPRMVEFILRPIVKHMMVISLNINVNEHLLKFCFMAAKLENARKVSHAVVKRLSECGKIVVTPSIVKEIESTNDVFFLFEYAAHLETMNQVKTFGERLSLLRLKEKILQKLGVTASVTDKMTIVIDHVDPTVMFSSQPAGNSGHKKRQAMNISNDDSQVNSDVNYNRNIITSLEKINGHNATKELAKAIRQGIDDMPIVLYIFSMVHSFSNIEYASLITNKLKEMLSNNDYTEDGPTKFEIRPVDYAFPVALNIVGRLLIYSFEDQALDLLLSCERPLFEDQSPLHYIIHFLNRYRSLLRPEMKLVFDRVASSLPLSNKMYIHFTSHSITSSFSQEEVEIEKINFVRKIAVNLLDNDMVLIQDPEIINREYHSMFTHCLVFSHLSLSLSSLSDEEIARLLYLPISDLSHSWMRRKDSCLALAKLASSMNNEVAFAYFKLLVEKKNSQIAILCGRLFLLECRIDVYNEICRQCGCIVSKKFEKLDFFLKIILPSFVRLKGGEEAATSLIVGFLECLGSKEDDMEPPKELVDEVLDAIGLFFMKLDLEKFTKQILAVVQKVAPELMKQIMIIIQTPKDIDSYWN